MARIAVLNSAIENFFNEVSQINAKIAKQSIDAKIVCEKYKDGMKNSTIFDIDLLIDFDSPNYTFLGVIKDGLVIMSHNHKNDFQIIVDAIKNNNYKCAKCGRKLEKNVFITLDRDNEIKVFGGACIDVVCPQYKIISSIIKKFEAWLKPMQDEMLCDDYCSFGRPYHWYYDVKSLMYYLLPLFKVNRDYNVKSDNNFEGYYRDYVKDEEVEKEIEKLKEHYINTPNDTKSDFLYNVYMTAKKSFQTKENTYIGNNFAKWVVSHYLKNVLFKENKPKVVHENQYKIGDSVKGLETTIINYKEVENNYSYYTTTTTYQITFKDENNDLFWTNTSKGYGFKIGDTVKISGKITAQFGNNNQYNKITRCKINI